MRAAFVLKHRSDRELLTGIRAAVSREREDMAMVIAHLAEMDRRGLALPEGCSSLSRYCIEVLHLSEPQAYRRVDVARLARKFPVILDMLADGLVNVTAVHRLGPSLTDENHVELLNAVVHKTREQIEEIVACLRPKHPVASLIRKLPNAASVSEAVSPVAGLFESRDSVGTEPTQLADSDISPRLGPVGGVKAEPPRPAPSHKPVVSPLAPDTYKI